VSLVGVEKASKFWEKMKENKKYKYIRERIIWEGYERIETKGTDTLVYAFVCPETETEGVVGFTSFVKEKKGGAKLPKASQANIMVMEVSKPTGDTTLIVPFAFYFNERPVGVEYKLFGASETDTIWVGEIWNDKAAMLSFILCLWLHSKALAFTCLPCIWTRGLLWPACLACVGWITYCALTSFL
jgi:hypothetical protein